ncbi:hypothetical protein E2C01_043286 [Portunus trituberculatus]|uniref:Uncharacterized protein n=1 Tax=Portunus trituberculatus TaxID=210409 RepID=A0A5B7FWW8_PORTR|nr:hypothetical protein [Portunus trituberculatus]
MASASAELDLSIGGQESIGNDSESTIIGFTGEVRAGDVIGRLPHMEESALDVRYSLSQWEALSASEALDAVGSVAQRAMNQAVLWSDFFNGGQGRAEPMAEYFQRCTQQALDCNLRCPECDSNLSDYMILRKAIVGLSNPTLKKELFLQYDMYSDVDKLRAKCLVIRSSRARLPTCSRCRCWL